MYDFIQDIGRGWRKIDSKNWQSIHPNEPLTLAKLYECGLHSTEKEWFKVLNRKFSLRDLDYFETMLQNGYELDEKSNIIIDTIHAVKGGEADHVVIFEKANYPSNFSTKNGIEKMAEARVWYTGVTRAKQTLHFLSTNHQYHFPIGKILSNYVRRQNDK